MLSGNSHCPQVLKQSRCTVPPCNTLQGTSRICHVRLQPPGRRPGSCYSMLDCSYLEGKIVCLVCIAHQRRAHQTCIITGRHRLWLQRDMVLSSVLEQSGNLACTISFAHFGMNDLPRLANAMIKKVFPPVRQKLKRMHSRACCKKPSNIQQHS